MNSVNHYGDEIRERRALWTQAALIVPVLGFTFFSVFRSLVSAWANRNDYSHGFLVPFVCLYFIWESRANLRSVAVRPAVLSGALLVAFSCTLLLAGAATSVQALQQISVFFAIPALVLLLLGWRFLKALALPIAYLVFMIPPLFDALTARLHWPFQLYSAAVAAFLLHIAGVPVHHNPQYLDLPGITLEVASECSGVRFLVSIVALGIPLAFVTQKTLWRRVALMVAALLIGIGLNPVRITLIGLWVHSGGAVLHGPYHILQGLFVSVAGFCILFLLAWFFSERDSDKPSHQGTAIPWPEVPWRHFHLALLVSAVLLGGTGVWLQVKETRPVRLTAPLSTIPAVLGGWTLDKPPEEPGFVLEGADESIDRVYRDQYGFQVRLQVGYYSLQRQGKEMVSYRLDTLYENARVVEIGKDQGRFEVNQVELQSRENRRLVLFWHHAGGKDVAGTFAAKAITARSWLFEGRNNGAVVIVSAELTSGDDSQIAIRKLANFALLTRETVALE